MLPDRHGSNEHYRYGFQGQEKDDELKGEGNSLNYTFRMHDPRVGRFFAVDPLARSFPWNSPYSFAMNNVIRYAELEGAELFDPLLELFGIKTTTIYFENKFETKNKITYVDGLQNGLASNLTPRPISFIEGTYIPTPDFFMESMLNIFGLQSPGQVHSLVEKTINPPLDQTLDYNLGYASEKLLEIVIFHRVMKKINASSKNSTLEFDNQGRTSININPESQTIIKVDLMSGPKGKKGFISYDKVDGADIIDDVVNFEKHFGNEGVDIVECNNPQANFIKEVQSSIKSGGKLIIRGTMSNPYFKSIFDMRTKIEGFTLESEQKGLSNDGYKRSDGTPIGGSNNINEIILKKE